MTETAKEYGGALYALCLEVGIAQDVLDELRVLTEAFAENPPFVRLLSNLGMAKEERVRIVDESFRGKIHLYLLNFLKILCERGSIGELAGCYEEYRARYNEDNGIVEATVTSAVPLSAGLRAKLTERLNAVTGKRVAIKERVNPALIGGIRLEMNGKRYDNSVQGRLEQIRSALLTAVQ